VSVAKVEGAPVLLGCCSCGCGCGFDLGGRVEPFAESACREEEVERVGI
jgi:hypothetical protein